jgi:hypothetical protein
VRKVSSNEADASTREDERERKYQTVGKLTCVIIIIPLFTKASIRE